MKNTVDEAIRDELGRLGPDWRIRSAVEVGIYQEVGPDARNYVSGLKVTIYNGDLNVECDAEGTTLGEALRAAVEKVRTLADGVIR